MTGESISFEYCTINIHWTLFWALNSKIRVFGIVRVFKIQCNHKNGIWETKCIVRLLVGNRIGKGCREKRDTVTIKDSLFYFLHLHPLPFCSFLSCSFPDKTANRESFGSLCGKSESRIVPLSLPFSLSWT